MPNPINGNPISVTPIPDNVLSPTSERAVKNKVVYNAVDDLNRQINDETTGLDTKAPVILETVGGAIASFNDGADDMPVKKLVALIDPVQDLHGYNHPWPGGAEVNKLNAKEQAVSTLNGIANQVYPNNRLVMSGTATGQSDAYVVFNTALFVPANSKIVISWYGTDNRNNDLVVYLRNINNQFPFYRAVANNSHSLIFNIADEQTFDAIMFRAFAGTTITSFDCNVEVSFGEAAPATYSPYSNICPISGWTGAEISNTGVNVWDEETEYGYYSSTTGQASPGINTQLRSKNYTSVKPSTSYCFKKPNTTGDILFYDANKSFISAIINLASNFVFTTPENCYYIHLNLGSNYGGTYNSDVSINYPATDTEYHPYTGNQISVTFPSSAGTVYGGTLTLNPDRTGTLVVDMAKGTLDGSQTIGMDESGVFYTDIFTDSKRIPGTAGQINTLSSMFAHDLNAAHLYSQNYDNIFNFGATYYGYAGNGGRLAIRFTQCSTIEEFKTWLQSNPTDFIYELTTPQTIQLTAEQVSGILETLYGTNNIWADTGDVTVTAPKDTKLYIDGKLAEIQATILENIGG